MKTTLLTIDGVAEELDCSRSNVRRMWYEGLLPAPIRLGRRGIRWRSDDIANFIANKATVTPSGASE